VLHQTVLPDPASLLKEVHRGDLGLGRPAVASASASASGGRGLAEREELERSRRVPPTLPHPAGAGDVVGLGVDEAEESGDYVARAVEAEGPDRLAAPGRDPLLRREAHSYKCSLQREYTY
jgi:hypothetical protein